MKSNKLISVIVLLAVVALLVYTAIFGLAGVSPIKDTMNLGLDIQGGVVLEYQAVIPDDMTEEQARQELDGTKAVMSTRIDSRGLMEPKVTVDYDQRRIRVEMPGVTDVNEAAKFIGTTAKLSFHKVADGEVLSGEAVTNKQVIVGEFEAVEIMDGGSIKNSEAKFINSTSYTGYVVNMELDGTGSNAFEDATIEFVNRTTGRGQIAIAVDGIVISAPWADEVLNSGECYISNMDQQSAIDLSLQIKSGALPLELEPIQSSLIGPTLGQDALDSSINAAIVGLCLVVLFMLVYYRVPGLIASVALILYTTIILFSMVLLNATLTLPGVAGIVLSLGMAVDANVVIFERLKEELRNGKTIRSAIKFGFKRAMRTIMDANITTLIAAAVLYGFGSGPIKGFATTLGIGIIASMFTAVVFTRTLLVGVDSLGIFKNRRYFGATGKTTTKTLQVLNHFKIWFAISAVIIVIGLGAFGINGLNLGIDFQGGTMVQYNLMETFDTAVIEDGLSEIEINGEKLDAEVITTGIDDTADKEVIIRTALSLDVDGREAVNTVVMNAFPNAEFRQTAQYAPAIGDEIKSRAVLAVVVASIGMLIYITFRFEVIFGLAAIVALLHDVLILVAVYAVFNIPVSSAFIAAVLTVVGYSINDTIVVFDRIRENVKFEKRPDYFEIANHSLSQTIVRSLNTSVTTLFVIGSLYFLGVDSIKELALPLMAGVLAGTYSSIFIASPVWALWKTYRSKKLKHYKGVKQS